MLLFAILCKAHSAYGESFLIGFARHLILKDILLLIIEGFMEFQISSQLLLVAPEDYIERNKHMYRAAIFFMIVTIVLLPCLLLYVIAKPFETLKQEKFKQVWGALYEDIRLKDSKSPLFNTLVFIVRRLIFIQIGFFLGKHGGMQVIFFLFLNLFAMIYLGNIKPYQLRRKNRIELFNETCVVLIGLHMPCFTDWLPDK
jgi:hypothetical protein